MVVDMGYWTKVSKRIIVLILTIIGIYLAFKLAIFYMPFLIAFIISLLIEPLIKFVNKKTKLTKCGKSMLIYSILNENKNKLKFLSKSDENIDLSMTAITEFKKHGVLPEKLQEEIENIQDEYLKTNLNDMFLIYQN